MESCSLDRDCLVVYDVLYHGTPQAWKVWILSFCRAVVLPYPDGTWPQSLTNTVGASAGNEERAPHRPMFRFD